MMKKIILVFKTHFDIGFTDLAENVIEQYVGSMLRQVLETCRATEDMGKLKYVWTMPSWPLWTVTKKCSDEMRPELEHYIENGQIAWHALPFTSHTDFCGEEEYLEGLRFGKELSEKYGKPYPIAAKMTDVPGHGLMLPEILGATGIRFLHLGCNAFATPPKVPELFFWKAPSGRKVLTMYCKGGYGSSLEAPEEWEYPVWMSLVHTHDNCGPHSAEFIKKLAAEAHDLYPEAEIVCGTMDDFCRELENYDLSGVPVVEQDLADTWIHGIGAYPREVREIRECRHRAARLQKLAGQTIRDEETGKKAEMILKEYYESMNLFGEHTWGADVKTWLGPDRVYKKEEFKKARQEKNYQFMEQSWEEQRKRAETCKNLLERYEQDLEKDREKREWLYNPLTEPYTGWVQGDSEPVYVKGLAPLACTKLERSMGDKAPKNSDDLTVEDHPEGSSVENHRYRLEFSVADGTITAVYDKKLNRRLLEAQKDTGIFSYQYTRHGIEKITEFLRSYGYRFSTWGIQDYGRENYPECKDETYKPCFVKTEVNGRTISFFYKGETSARLYGDCHQAEVRITLPDEGEELFVSLLLSGKEASPYVESGSFCLPLAGDLDNYRINKPGSVLNPKTDIADNGNHVLYSIEEFAAADNRRSGVCVMPLDTPLMSIGEDGIYTYRHQYEEHTPILYFNTFNNMWGTNFPQWQEGDSEYRFVLWGYDAKDADGLLERSVQLGEGIQRTSCEAKKLNLTLPCHMQLLNIKQGEDGMILVTRDLRGEEAEGTVCMPGYYITETDYYGRQTGELKRDSLTFVKKKYGLHIFKVEKV